MTPTPPLFPPLSSLASNTFTSATSDKGAASISADVSAVVAQIGYLPPALTGALAYENYNLVDHHRRSVLKHHKLPGGKAAQRFLASRLHRYGSKKDPTELADLVGESFAAAQTGKTFGRERFRKLEEGGERTTSRWFAVPIGALQLKSPGARSAAYRRFREQLSAHMLVVVGKGLLIRRDAHDQGAKTKVVKIIGKLVRARREQPMLGFQEQFDRVLPGHMARYDKALDLAMTEAGRDRLARDLQTRARGAAAYRAVYDQFLNANAGKFSEARRVAKAAAKAARAAGGGQDS